MEQQNQNGAVANAEVTSEERGVERFKQYMNNLLEERQRIERERIERENEAHLLRKVQPMIQHLREIAQQTPEEAFPLQIHPEFFHAPINGLTRERIGKFEHFSADESLVGEQCVVCLDDLEVGTHMVRLDCHVSHYLCKTCTDAWFENHNKCPLCNHIFH